MGHQNVDMWKIIQQRSFDDSFLSGHESPYDEVKGGKPLVENPTEVFKTLDGISQRLRDAIDKIEDPWQFYPTLIKEAAKIADGKDGGENLPQSIRETIGRMIRHISEEIGSLYEDRPDNQTPETENPNHTAQRAIDDIKKISWVPLDSNNVLEAIQVKEARVDKIEGLQEIIPQLKSLTPHSGIKGGAARLALKLLALQNLAPTEENNEIANTLLGSIEAELPLADIDLIMTEEEQDPHGFAERMGVSPVDIEKMHDMSKGSLIDHFGRRDLSSNQAILKADALYYTKQALSDLMTNPGLARSIVPTIPGVFGRECFYVNRRLYRASNTLYRLVKMASEGKNTHFTAPRYNLAAIPLGKHWLTMARKWLKREDRSKVFASAYSCAKQMGATTAATPADFFEELLKESPDFTFTDQQTVLDVAKWLSKKYIIFLEKILRRKFRLHPERVEEVFANTDETEVTVRPDLSGITETDLAAVEAVFKRIEEKENFQRTEPRDNSEKQKIISSLGSRREQQVSGLKMKMETMRKNGPRNGNLLKEQGQFAESGTVTRAETGTVYFKDWLGHNFKVSLADLELRYEHPNPVWVLKNGAKTEKIPDESDKRPSVYPREPWRRGGGWGGYGAP